MDYEKKQKIYKIVMIVVLTAFITFIGTTLYIYNVEIKNKEVKYDVVKNDDISQTLSNLRSILEEEYLGDITEEELVTGAIKGYIKGLEDPYTEYMTPKEYEEFLMDTNGNYTGIGITMVRNLESNTIVVAPIKDTPAEKSGILPKDVILKVDDIAYPGDKLSDAANIIRGEIGTKVKLQIQRGEEILEIEIIREKIQLKYVESKIIEKDIGYIEISSFDGNCGEDFINQYEELKKQNIKGLVIDLRNNPGGLVSEALTIANAVVDKDKTLLITIDKNGNKKYSKATKNKVVDVPVVVLVNENSASASEILAGAIKDNNAGVIIGTTTYGKGIIQQLFPLTDGSAVKITTQEYLSPNETKIHKIGIEPNIVVTLPEEYINRLEIPYDSDTQLQKAIVELK